MIQENLRQVSWLLKSDSLEVAVSGPLKPGPGDVSISVWWPRHGWATGVGDFVAGWWR